MAQQFYQIRYYGDDVNSIEKNYPPRPDKVTNFSETILNLKSGNNILSSGQRASYIKVHTIPGVKLVLNKGITELTADKDCLLEANILIGTTGIYELDLQDYDGIKIICFENTDLINEQDNSYLIINIY